LVSLSHSGNRSGGNDRRPHGLLSWRQPERPSRIYAFNWWTRIYAFIWCARFSDSFWAQQPTAADGDDKPAPAAAAELSLQALHDHSKRVTM
jgi:hypothetical protein